MAIDTGGLAFPLPGMTLSDGRGYASNPGMTLRDWFAGQVLVGVWSDSTLSGTPKTIAEGCYEMADAMLAERAKVQS